MRLALALVALASAAAQPLGQPDHHHDRPVTTVGFGSCHTLEQGRGEIWAEIAAADPDLWIWMGDVVYARPSRSRNETFGESLVRRYRELSDAAHPYAQFVAQVEPAVVGVYDDHDLGSLGWPNDGGKESPWRALAQDELLRFMGEPAASPLFARDGMYSSHTFGAPGSGRRLRVIVMDTRGHRDPHWLPSVATWTVWGRRIPASALVACLTRAAVSALGLSRDYAGDVLGEEQWAWLDAQLAAAAAEDDATLLVSSVQLLGTAGLTESWGHFPRAKARLLGLLARHRPPGLVVLSGDVHYAEAASLTGGRELGELLEVTSSSLTHSCGTGALQRYVCWLTHWAYDEHRLGEAFRGNNYGLVGLRWDEGVLDVSVRDERSREVVAHSQPLEPVVVAAPEERLHTHDGGRGFARLAVAGVVGVLLPLAAAGEAFADRFRDIKFFPTLQQLEAQSGAGPLSGSLQVSRSRRPLRNARKLDYASMGLIDPKLSSSVLGDISVLSDYRRERMAKLKGIVPREEPRRRRRRRRRPRQRQPEGDARPLGPSASEPALAPPGSPPESPAPAATAQPGAMRGRPRPPELDTASAPAPPGRGPSSGGPTSGNKSKLISMKKLMEEPTNLKALPDLGSKKTAATVRGAVIFCKSWTERFAAGGTPSDPQPRPFDPLEFAREVARRGPPRVLGQVPD